MSKFNEQDFEHKLFKLKDSHDSIASLSNWCLSHVEHHGKIVSTWLGTLKKVKIEHRILLFYLANDIIQYSKKKGLAYVATFAPALQKATTMVRDAAIKNKILRIFQIWDERNIYDESFLVDLSSLLTRGHKTANRIDLDEFQPNLLYSRLKSCQTLEEDTDAKMKLLVENPMPMTDTERLRSTLKNRKASEDVIAEIDEGTKKIAAFISALEAEIKERAGLIDLLEISEQYYEKEMGEAKVVSNAYKCFTNRVKLVKKKLDEKMESLPSPVPTPSPTAPSPEPEPLDDEDSKAASFEFKPGPGGASFLDGSLFNNQTVTDQFQSFYNNVVPAAPAPDKYSPSSSAYNGNASTTILPGLMDPADVPLAATVPPLPINVPPVFNYFRPIAEVVPPPPPPPPPVPPEESVELPYDSSFLDSTAELSTGGLKIEVINSPSKEPSLSTILETMVNDSLQPPPVPPNMDFPPNWNDNPDYWESPESPPLFEKEGQAPPTLDDITDVDMRSKDVDHRNLISLTGGVEGDWEFPPADVDIPQDNEDMEMSDEDVGEIENINDGLIPGKKELNIVPPVSDSDFRVQANPEFPDNLPADQIGVVKPVQTGPSYALPPPPPPPPMVPGPPLNTIPQSPERQGWASQFPPPPTPPFEPLPFLPLDVSTPLRPTRDQQVMHGKHIPIKPPPLPPTFPQQRDSRQGYNSYSIRPDAMMGMRPAIAGGPQGANDIMAPIMGPRPPTDDQTMGPHSANDIRPPMMDSRPPIDGQAMMNQQMNDIRSPMMGPRLPNDGQQMMGPQMNDNRPIRSQRRSNDGQMMGSHAVNDIGQPIPSFDNYNQEMPQPRFHNNVNNRFRQRFDFRGGGPPGFFRGGGPQRFGFQRHQRPRFPHQGF